MVRHSKTLTVEDFNYVHDTLLAFSSVKLIESFRKITMNVHIVTGIITYDVTYRLGNINDYDNKTENFSTLEKAIEFYNKLSLIKDEGND